MSIAPASETYSCSYCDQDFQAGTAVAGSYCSRACHLRDRGASVLDDLRHDHTICATCFAELKETDHPGDERLRRGGVSSLVREAVVGFEYPTPNAERADGAPHPGDESAGLYARETPTTHTPLACRCGAVDTHDHDATLARVEGAAVVVNLLARLGERYDRGAIDHAPSQDRLFDALREAGRDWEYATGYALYGGEA